MSHTQPVNGQDALDAQENALNLAENLLGAQVTKYAKKTSGVAAGAKTNEAVLDDVPGGQDIHPLYLKAVATGTDPSQVAPPQAGQTKVFDGNAYVSGAEQLVLGFRQP